jgi:hypothetical protein
MEGEGEELSFTLLGGIAKCLLMDDLRYPSYAKSRRIFGATTPKRKLSSISNRVLAV